MFIDLHSTMVRFIIIFYNYMLQSKIDLHSTMVRFISPAPCVRERLGAYLHSTMVRFILYRFLMHLFHPLIYIPLWLDLLADFILYVGMNVYHLHSTMVRFIIVIFHSLYSYSKDLHSTMVRFIMSSYRQL